MVEPRWGQGRESFAAERPPSFEDTSPKKTPDPLTSIGETWRFEEDGYLNESVDQSAELVLRLKQLLDDVRPWNFPVQLARNLTQAITDHFALLYAARLTMRIEYCRAKGIESLIDHEVQAIHETE